ncbi:hypothetical protein ACIQM4_23705 [Streptomyces sp. NPDC091272]|uniref:hypothetical protein n=1 Tax=Streptomyces sp. NPDC091272 TaxID=3365981 RepID=UPI0037FF5DF9
MDRRQDGPEEQSPGIPRDLPDQQAGADDDPHAATDMPDRVDPEPEEGTVDEPTG